MSPTIDRITLLQVNGEHRYQLIKKPKGTLEHKFFSASVVAFWNAKQHVCAPLFERPAIWAPEHLGAGRLGACK